MSNTILVIGESGTGKSSSIRNLNHEETFIISALDKPLPIRGFKKKYIKENQDNRMINFFVEKNPMKIISMIKAINERRPEIKTLILDDFQYIMANYLLRVNAKKGPEVFEKFRDIGTFVWNIIDELQNCRSEMNCYVLIHSDLKDDGTYKAKTVGKMIDNQICLEGMFTIILHSLIINKEYKFLTQNDGVHLAKSLPEMFKSEYIDNDLNEINNIMNKYFNEDINQ
jgi:hypothetical protein